MDNREKKRKKIIDVSLQLFIKNGFHGTPTSLIAKKSGVATGTLFNYFKTKDILINEIFKEIKLEQKKNILKDISGIKTSKMKLNKIWNNLILWGLDNSDKKKFLEYFSNSYYISDDTRIEINKNFKFLLDIFRDIINKKGIKEINELMLILNFMGACVFTCKYFYLANEAYDKKLSNKAFERFCKGIELTDED